MATLNSIAALTRRDLAIELSYHFQFVLRYFSILISLAMFFFLGRLVGDAEELSTFDHGYFEFALVGLVVMNFSQATVTSFSRSIQSAQDDGTFEILLSTSAGLPTLMAGTLMVPMAFAAIDAGVFIAVGWTIAGFVPPLAGIVIASLLLILTVGTFAAIGILSATVIILTKRGDPFSSLVLLVSSLLAGAVFPVSVLPDALQAIARVVPAFYGLSGMREVLLAGGGVSDVAGEIAILTLFNAVLLPLSLFAMSRAIRIGRVTGTLGNR